MTDLERVRPKDGLQPALDFLADYVGWATADYARQCIDAHRLEDVESWEGAMKYRKQLQAELTRLREALTTQTELGQRDREQRDTLLAALREISDTPTTVSHEHDDWHWHITHVKEIQDIARAAIYEAEGEPTDAEVLRGLGYYSEVEEEKK